MIDRPYSGGLQSSLSSCLCWFAVFSPVLFRGCEDVLTLTKGKWVTMVIKGLKVGQGLKKINHCASLLGLTHLFGLFFWYEVCFLSVLSFYENVYLNVSVQTAGLFLVIRGESRLTLLCTGQVHTSLRSLKQRRQMMSSPNIRTGILFRWLLFWHFAFT